MTKTNARRLSLQIKSDFDKCRADGFGICESIRTTVAMYEADELRVEEMIAALPEINPATIRIQFRKSRRITADMKLDKIIDAKIAAKKSRGPLITEQSKQLFIDLASDAGNWSGTPMLDGNVCIGQEGKGNLTQLKRAKLIKTFRDEGETWVSFTEAGQAYAKELGIDLCII